MPADSPPPADARADDARARVPAALAVGALCVLTFLAKSEICAPRTSVNHGDVSFYYTVAKNVAEGRGFVIDYIWNFWNDPQGFPTPANIWWMPLASMICAVGMALFGVSYAVAQASMIVATSVLPLVIYLLGREIFGGRLVPLLGACLAATFHLFMDQPSAPLSHGPYVVLAPLAFWLMLRAARTGRGWIWAGVAIGATQMARSDGVLLFGALGTCWLLARPRPPVRALALAVLGYVLAMAPWWTHNLVELGVIQPPGSFRAVFLRGYEQWYSLPSSVSWDSFRSDGWGPIWDLKRDVAERNLFAGATGLVSGAADRKGAWDSVALQAVLWLAWLGVAWALLAQPVRRRLAPVGVQLLAIFAFYTLLFTAVGPESFRTGMFSLYGVLLLCAAFALVRLFALLARLIPSPAAAARAGPAAAVLCTGWLMLGHYEWATTSMARKAAGITELNRFYDNFREKMLPRLGPDPVIMARDVHELHALTGVRCVQIPLEEEHAIRIVARRYGVTHILLFGEPDRPARPALRDIDGMPWVEKVMQGRALGELWRVYRIRE